MKINKEQKDENNKRRLKKEIKIKAKKEEK